MKRQYPVLNRIHVDHHKMCILLPKTLINLFVFLGGGNV